MTKILCVDDDPRNLKLLDALLVPAGYEVLPAENGEKALKIVQAENPDLVLLDIMMPGLSGYDVLKRLREDKKIRDIPVVMVTALVDVRDRIKALEAGCDDFISKPFDKTELLSRVRSLLRISYYRRQLDEKEKFAAVIQEMGDGVIVCSPDWVITELNASAAKYLNVVGGKGKNLLDLFYNGFSPSLPREELAGSAKPKVIFDIIRKETELANPFYLEAALDFIKDPEGKTTNIVASLRDVTEQRKEAALERDFLAVISHKIRTPFTGLKGQVDMLKEGLMGALNKEQNDSVIIISRSINRLIELFERLFAFIRVEKIGLSGKSEPVDLSSLLTKMVEGLHETNPGRKIAVKMENIDKLTALSVPKEWLSIIFANLFENAVKFNDEPEVLIKVTATPDTPKMAKIAFSDNGKGIPSEEYERIFEPFYQAEKKFTGQVEGVGLGLPLVKKIIEKVGGSIRVESKPGEGTTFYFTLPL